MVKRRKQKIISWFGWRVRNGKKENHRAIDVRTWNFLNWKRQKIVFPDNSFVLRIVYQKKWGWTVVFNPLNHPTITEVLYTHITDPKKAGIQENTIYEKGELIGYSARTDYMIKKELGEHLHMETKAGTVWKDPVKYMEYMGIK